MSFLFSEDSPRHLVLATHNQGKWREFADLLGPYDLHVSSAAQLGLPSPEETGTSFEANAILKARAAAEATGLLSLADDSGLCVSALDGRPGIFSARWAEPDKDFVRAMQRIQDEVGDNPDRSAFFICVLALYWPDGRFETVEGRVDGTLALTPRGAYGHGYDPLFIPDGEVCTFAEMDDSRKNEISHRGRATRKLTERFFEP